jgi:hypothetical protein
MSAIVEAVSSSRDALPVCLWHENPNRLVSLWDIVNHFDAHGFAELVLQLTGVHELHTRLVEMDGGLVDSDFTKNALVLLKRIQKYCGAVEFERCAQVAADIQFRIRNSAAEPNVSTLNNELLHVRDELMRETFERAFLVVSCEMSEYLDEEFLFGKEVYGAFPKARIDVTASGNCIALDLPDGAVFYLMRVAEHGLRKLAARLHVVLTDRGTRQLAEYADWDKVITGAKNKIDIVRHTPKGPKRATQLELYSNAADHCLYMKEIWRNHVSHAGRSYSQEEALAAFGRVREFMIFLAGSLGGR